MRWKKRRVGFGSEAGEKGDDVQFRMRKGRSRGTCGDEQARPRNVYGRVSRGTLTGQVSVSDT